MQGYPEKAFVLGTVDDVPGLWEQQSDVYVHSGHDGSRAIRFLTRVLSLPSILCFFILWKTLIPLALS